MLHDVDEQYDTPKSTIYIWRYWEGSIWVIASSERRIQKVVGLKSVFAHYFLQKNSVHEITPLFILISTNRIRLGGAR